MITYYTVIPGPLKTTFYKLIIHFSRKTQPPIQIIIRIIFKSLDHDNFFYFFFVLHDQWEAGFSLYFVSSIKKWDMFEDIFTTVTVT